MIGVNRKSDASGNPLISAERSLPWIQDTVEADVWAEWSVTYRDVMIVDGSGERVGVYNLTSNDLGVAANALALEDMIAAAAVLPDADGDRLSDLWERETFGGLTAASAGQPEAVVAYAFGAGAVPRAPYMELRMIRQGADGLFAQVAFDARLGGAAGLLYSLEISADGGHWAPLEVVVLDAVPHFDGTAMARYTFRSLSPLRQPVGLVRARAEFVPR